MGEKENEREEFIRAIRKFMEMRTLTKQLIRLSEPRPADLDSVALAKPYLHSVVMKSYSASGSVRSHSIDSSSFQIL